MNYTDAFRWAVLYVALWSVATIVGLIVVGVGVGMGGLAAVGLVTPGTFRMATLPYLPTPGLAALLLGILIWKFGTAAALLKIFTDAVQTETAGALDTQSVKSDILSVLDDRLSDMHQEVTQTKRLVDRLSRDEAASEFEFE